MTKEELMELLRDPDQTGQAVVELNSLIEKNPYFHTGHQLYIKGLQQTDEKKMALQLRRTALSVRDRGVLYNYINRSSSFPHEPLATDHAEAAEAPFVPGNSFVSSQVDEAHQVQHVFPETALLPGQDAPASGAKWQDTEAHVVSEGKIMSDDQLMEMIRQRLDQIGSPLAETVSETDTGVEIYSEESTSDDLINSFLNSNHKITPDQNNQYEPDLSVGLQESTETATETLAEIYAAQGHKDKAIEVYRQLILKYPEKHIYFAHQIDRIKS